MTCSLGGRILPAMAKLLLVGSALAASMALAAMGEGISTRGCAPNVVSGSNAVSGCGNTVSGVNNVVRRHHNVVSGVNNQVYGSCLVVSGVGGYYTGNHCR